VAAATGGIPEMVRPRDRARVLCELSAESLADKLAEVHERGLAPAALRVSPERTIADWLQWHEQIVREHEASRAAATAATAKNVSTPLPRVSVCVTHRNRPAYLGAALDSIRDQDYPAIEVILVDDGSDEPAAIAALDAFEPEFARRGWTILRRPNRYPGAARNAAVEVAQGDYILFMDDDNLAEPHEVRTLVQAAEQSGADILTCLLSVFQGRGLAPTGAPLHIWPFLGAAIAPGMLRNVFGDANALIRRSVFDRIGGFTEDFGVGNEDWEFFARAVLRGMRLEVVRPHDVSAR
jgi:GT2 family glycosyltransferase